VQKEAKAGVDCGRMGVDGEQVIRPAEVLLGEAARLRKVIAGMGLGVVDAEDVFQVVSVKCLTSPCRFADHRQCLRWLIQVTTHECITEHRRRSRFQKRADDVLRRIPSSQDPRIGPMQRAEAAERFEAVQGALRDLDEAVLRPLVLRYFSDLSSTEIGELLGMPASTVRSTLRQARMALAKALVNRGIDR